MRTFITFVCALILCLSFVSAETQINIYIDAVGDALFLGSTDETSLVLPEGVTMEQGRIRGSTSNLTGKEGEVWSFAYTLPNSDLTLTLPEGAVITSLSDGVISLDGKQISLSAPDRVFVSYSIEKTTDVSSNIVLGIIIASLILIVVIGYGGHTLKRLLGRFIDGRVKKQKARRTERKNKLEHLKPLLHEREHLILAQLKTLGKVKMSYLRKHTNLPKASFSRHIHELEKKQIIILSGEGKNQFIELKRTFQ